MVKALLDTNILIDFLRGIPSARDELNRYTDAAISVITWMEVLAGASEPAFSGTRNFLNGFRVAALDQSIAERAATLRRERRLKLPDAIIWASAQVQGRLFVTRDTETFPTNDPGVRVPYHI